MKIKEKLEELAKRYNRKLESLIDEYVSDRVYGDCQDPSETVKIMEWHLTQEEDVRREISKEEFKPDVVGQELTENGDTENIGELKGAHCV